MTASLLKDFGSISFGSGIWKQWTQQEMFHIPDMKLLSLVDFVLGIVML